MITAMRSTLKGPIFRIILSIAVLAMLGAMIVPALLDRTGQKTKEWIYQVNGQSISAQKYYKTIQMLQSQRSNALKSLTQQYGPELALQVLQLYGLDFDPALQAEKTLVGSEALSQQADALKIDLPTDLVMTHAISQLPPELIDENGNVDIARLQQVLPSTTLEEFEEESKKQLRNSQVLDLVTVGGYIPNFVLKNAYMQQFARKNYGVVFFPQSHYLGIAKKTPVTAEQLNQFFDQQNKINKRYWLPEKRSVTVWSFSPDTYGVKVSDAEIEKYYKANKRQEFVDRPLEMQVHKIVLPWDNNNVHKSRVEASMAHEKLKKDPSSFKAQAKETIWVGRQNPDDVVEQKIFGLKNDGDITEPIQVKEGLEVYQRVKKSAQTYKPLKSVEKDIRTKLLDMKFNKAFSKASRRAMNQYRDGNESALTDFAKAHKGTMTTQVVTRSDANLVATNGFNIKRIKGLSAYFDGNKGNIEQLTAIEKRREPAFDSVKKQVESDWYTSQATQLRANALKKGAELAKKEPLSKVAAALGVQFKTSGLVSGENEEKMKKLQSENFPANLMMSMSQKGVIKEEVSPETSYLVKLFDIEAFDQKAFDEKKLKLSGQLRQQQDNLMKEAFIASLLQNATIKVNDSLKTQ